MYPVDSPSTGLNKVPLRQESNDVIQAIAILKSIDGKPNN